MTAVHDERTESAVEIEIGASPEIRALLTTTNGQLNGALNGKTLGGEFAKYLQAKFPSVKPIESLEFDQLTDGDKARFLQLISERKKTSFFTDRRVPGIKIKDSITITLTKPTLFLGEFLPVGTHELQVGKFLGKVEYMGTTNDPRNFELHFRAKVSAGLVSSDARQFLSILGVQNTHQHIHTPVPLPLKALQENPDVQPLVMLYYWLRANFVMESISVADEGIRIKDNASWTAKFFGSLRPEQAWRVLKYLQSQSNPDAEYVHGLGDEVKMAWIGFRGHDKFDAPNLYGWETRAITATGEANTYREFLDTIQWGLENNSFGIPVKRFLDWVSQQTDPDRAMVETWYNRPWRALLKSADPRVRSALGNIFLKIGYRSRTRENQELKMLVHNWGNDPLIFDDPTLKEKIVAAQVEAIARVKTWEDVNTVMKNFLDKSGLRELFNHSMGGDRTPEENFSRLRGRRIIPTLKAHCF